MGEHHDHHHDHDHSDVPSELALRAMAIQSLLVEKGVVEQSLIDRVVEANEHRFGPHLGAAVVARAWTDPDFKAALIADGTTTVNDMDIDVRVGARVVVLENTDNVHNLVVCTLCSCYPSYLLGLPPVWYKSAPYRSRAVHEPRTVMAEFGTEIDDDIEVRVWDSNSEVRYLVLPQRPAGTDEWTEEQLAGLVSRNAMIGVERASDPEQVAAS